MTNYARTLSASADQNRGDQDSSDVPTNDPGELAAASGQSVDRELDRLTCFFERSPSMALAPRVTAEGVGTLLLMLAATGAGLAAPHVLPNHNAFARLTTAGVSAGALVSLIVAFGSVSGGHFNPLITGLQWLAGQRRLDCTLAYIAAQLGGAFLGAVLATYLFGIEDQAAALTGTSWKVVFSEVIASAGLMIVVFGCARSGRADTGPFAVGAWLAGAIIATPSTSYANPAIALAAIAAGGPIALSANIAVFYVSAEIAGALLALVVVAIVYPLHSARERPSLRTAIITERSSP